MWIHWLSTCKSRAPAHGIVKIRADLSLQYWDWAKYAESPQTSPIFNGDPYSLGGNGEWVPHDSNYLQPPPGTTTPIKLPGGLGGGYVNSGPFVNLSVNLGPVIPAMGTPPGPDGGLGYNPRRIKRDVGPAINMLYANYSTIHGKLRHITSCCCVSSTRLFMLLIDERYIRSSSSTQYHGIPKDLRRLRFLC
jgi:hypothetical protein